MSLEFGYIALQRDLVNWEWYSNINVKVLYLELLLSVNYEDKEWQGITVKKGSIITSLPMLAVKTGLTNQQVRTALKKLVDSNYLTDKSTNKFRYISVIDYDRYVSTNRQVTDKQQTSNRQVTDKQQTSNSNVISTKNYKEIKEIKEIKEKEKTVADATPPAKPKPEKSKPEKSKYGEYKNVLLTLTEYEKLKDKFNDYENKIKNLDEYIEMKGAKYESHYLVIIRWAKADEGDQTEKVTAITKNAVDKMIEKNKEMDNE